MKLFSNPRLFRFLTICNISANIAVVLFIISLLLPFPAHASMLMPSGGWLMDDSTRIRTYTDFSKIYRLSGEHISGYDFEGAPITETINFVDVAFDSKSTALGSRHCMTEPKTQNLVVVFSLSKEAVTNSWLFDGKNFNKIATDKVSCKLTPD
jgi:hypothetical protein